MFDGLDGVEWGRYRHAYGNATDVPDMLRRWIDPVRAVRDEAVRELWACLLHQDELQPAAAAAVPFFLEALTSGPPDLAADAFHFLGDAVHPGLATWFADGWVPDDHPVPAAYGAARLGLGSYLALLDPDVSDRPFAARRPDGRRERTTRTQQVCGLLCWFPLDAAAVAAALRRRLDGQPATRDRIPLLLCLAMQNRHLGATPDLHRFADAFVDGASDGERLAGALCLARVRRIDAVRGVVEAIVGGAERPGTLGYEDEHPANLFPTGGDLVADGLLAAIAPYGFAAGEAPSPSDRPLVELARQVAHDVGSDVLVHFGYRRAGPATLSVESIEADSARYVRWRPAAAVVRVHAFDLVGAGELAVSAGERRIALVSLSTGAIDRVLESPQGQRAATTVRVDSPGRADMERELRSRGFDLSLATPSHSLLRIGCSPDGRWLASDEAGIVHLWDLHADSPGPSIDIEGFPPTRVLFAWSADSSVLAATDGLRVFLWRSGAWLDPGVVDLPTRAQSLRFTWSGSLVARSRGGGDDDVIVVNELDATMLSDVATVARTDVDGPRVGPSAEFVGPTSGVSLEVLAFLPDGTLRFAIGRSAVLVQDPVGSHTAATLFLVDGQDGLTTCWHRAPTADAPAGLLATTAIDAIQVRRRGLGNRSSVVDGRDRMEVLRSIDDWPAIRQAIEAARTTGAT